MKKTLPKTREGFERPSNQPDYMTTSELRDIKFSGTRKNSITGDMEIWTLGDLRRTVPATNKDAFERAFAEVFALSDVKISDK